MANLNGLLAFFGRRSMLSQKAFGFYTIEIMLSFVLGSIVIAVLLSLTFAGWSTYLVSMSYANTSDSSRAAFIFLDRQFSLAGYRARMWEDADAVFPEIPASIDGLYPAFGVGQVIAAQAESGSGGNNQRNVILYIRKQGGFQDDYDASGSMLSPLPWASSLTTDTVITDCLGERIPSEVIIIERYRIDAAKRQLVCMRVYVSADSPAYYGVSTQETPIIDYAYAMRAAFGGYDQGDPEAQIQKYLDINSMLKGTPSEQVARWSRMVNIQLDILIVRGDNKMLDNSVGRSNIGLVGDNHVTVPADSRFVTVESRIIHLRNRAY